MYRSLLLRAIPLISIISQATDTDTTDTTGGGGGGGGGNAGVGIGAVASNITGQLESVGNLVVGIAQVAGLVFMAAGLFKLKQHKDNPQQIPIGTPLTMLIIGACLAFLPSLVTTGGETVFGSKAKGGQYDGTGLVIA